MSNQPVNTVPAAKKALRERLRALTAGLDADSRRAQSLRVVDLVRRHPLFTRARAVLLFAPLADEVDVSPLVEAALAGGITVALPRHCAHQGEYEAARVTQPLSELPRGAFNIPEPGPGAPVVDWKLLDFVVIPGLAFGRDCFRLGRGRGFYDRLLTKAQGTKCGVAFEHQVVEVVPVEPHDMPLDLVAVSTGWIVSSGLSA